jgi:hypothetical protein
MLKPIAVFLLMLGQIILFLTKPRRRRRKKKRPASRPPIANHVCMISLHPQLQEIKNLPSVRVWRAQLVS